MAISGCSKTENVQEISAASWSDNSEQIAFLEKKYDRVHGIDETSIKNIRYRLGITDRNDRSRQYITQDFNYRNEQLTDLSSKELYYKSNSGYFLVRVGNSGSFISNSEIFTDNVEYEFYDSSGNIIHQILKTPNEYCDQFHTAIPVIRAMPSPTGNKIAVVETLSTCELNIDIMTYNGSFEVLTTERIEGIGIGGLFWVDENNLLINSCLWIGCTDNWTLIRIGEIHSINQELFESICLSGVVVSSEINASWEKIDWSHPGNHPNISETESFNHTELGYFKESNTRKPDNPEGCISIENI